VKTFGGTTREFLLIAAVFLLGHAFLLLEVFPQLHRAMVAAP
jgi:hypothetical protein